MKTIEEYQVEIQQKKEIARQMLDRFQDGLSSIGSIIKKDPSYVYDVVCRSLEAIELDYDEMVNVSVSSLEYISDRFNVVIGVLEEVMLSLDAIEQKTDTEEISVENFVNEKMENLAENAESTLSEVFEDKKTMASYLTTGLLTFAGLKFVLKTGILTSIAGAAVAVYLVSEKNK